ncbi:DNA repair protein RAD50 [Neocloeon triangulifer]|uniref:DNA repair protein RAD50 n=1 Tax=Neocloeon triangulifer TaxID=2078957 RepID=UPI00286EC70D|nr:DNA repair protein RAD50 [Neocloeon triangulifer]
MASIHSLNIRGIRSFGTDNDDEQAIKFISPITCIVGQNGCGKTTIIESLRYATTGVCPPGTDKGKSFVYDPKLTRAGESLGQVKLRFNSTKKTVMQIKRSVRCTTKGNKIEMKTLEPTVEYIDKYGNKNASSGRCQDINQMVTSNMGVSAAILENVIFCHQEDSLWPLDESKKLKEKFDDIFDAAKYNKAADSLIKTIKAKKIDFKVAKTGIELHKQNWDTLVKKNQELERDSKRYREGEEEIEELKQKKRPMSEELSKIHQRESDYSDLRTQVATLTSSRSDLMNQQEHIKKQIKNLHKGSRQELEEEMRNFKADIELKEKEIVELEEEIAKLSRDEKAMASRIQQEQMELGKLTQEEKTFKGVLESRLRLLQSIAKELDKNVKIESPDDKSGYEKAQGIIEKGIQDEEVNLKNVCKEQDSIERAQENEIYKLRDELSKAQGKVAQLETSIEQNDNQLKSNTAELRKVDSGLAKVSVLETRLNRVKEDLKAEEDNLDIEESQREILSTQGERKDLEDEYEVISKEINVLQLAKGHQAEADVYKKSIEDKQEGIKSLMEKNKDGLKNLFAEIPETKLKSAVDKIIATNEKERAIHQKALQDFKDAQISANADLAHAKKQLEEIENTLKVEENKIQKECGNKDLDAMLRETEAELQKATDQKGILDSSCVLFRRYITVLKKEDPCCPLCHRDFKAKKETDKLIDELNIKVKDYPVQIEDQAKSQKALQFKLSQLQQLIPSQKKLMKMQTEELPQLREQIEDYEMTLAVAIAEENSAVEKLKVPETKLKIAESLKADMAFVDKYQEEICKVEEKLREVEEKLAVGGSSRSLEEAQEDQNRISASIKRLQKIAEDKQNALNKHQKRVNDLKDRKNELTKELLDIRSGEQRKTQLLDLVKQLTEKDKQFKRELKEAEEAIRPKQDALNAANEEKSIVKMEHNALREANQKKLSNFRSRLASLKEMNKSVETYEARNLSRKLEDLRANVEKLTEKKDKVNLAKENMSDKKVKFQKDLASQNVKQRDLNDNLRLFELREKIATAEGKLSDLQEKLGNLNFVELMERKNKLNSTILSIMNNISHLEGAQKELKSKINELKQELDKPIMKNAEATYKQKHVNLLVEERIIKDLHMYLTALEQAVIHFHKERMAEVNRIVRELWISIYKGSDIDHIEIKTEKDEKQAATTRKSYNYRVVMVRQERELDMRGRCSAGQKMLASLVIRIALAETFSSSCGILALDEPTTNLDAANIESLGNSLIELTQSHRMQKNFQLLIITHDEDFIEKLTQAQLIESFYRVTRDNQGHSKIKKFKVGGTREGE